MESFFLQKGPSFMMLDIFVKKKDTFLMQEMYDYYHVTQIYKLIMDLGIHYCLILPAISTLNAWV